MSERGLTELKSMCWQSVFLLEAIGRILFFLPPASRGLLHFLVYGLLPPSAKPAVLG